MKIKTLLIVSLLFALCAGNTNAQSRENWSIYQNFENPSHALDGGWTFVNEQSTLYGVITPDDSPIYHPDMDNPTWIHSFHFQAGSTFYSYLISPLLESSDNGVHLEFWYTNYYLETPSNFRVGYSLNTNNPDDFVWGDLIYADKGTIVVSKTDVPDPWGWKLYTGDLPAGVKFVAITFPSGQISGNLFIDDILITPAACTTPSMFQVTGITDESISLSWQGNSETYDIQHAPFQFYDFEDEDAFYEDWQSVCDGESEMWLWADDYIDIEGRYESHCVYSDIAEQVGHNYLVSPRVSLGGSISFYAMSQTGESQWKKKDGSKDDIYYNTQFQVMVYVGDDLVLNEEVIESQSKIISGPLTAADDWMKHTFALDEYEGYQPGDEGYVIICHINDGAEAKDDYYCYLLVDDCAIIEPYTIEENGYGQTTYTMDNLDEKTCHAFQVRSNGEGDVHSSWTDPLYVKTLPADPAEMPDSYMFVNNGYWNKPSCWASWYVPQNVEDAVTVLADATIPEGCVAQGTITMDGGSITIKDGGQLKHNNGMGENITVTAQKRIAAYPAEGKTGYYLMASPNEMNPENVTNMLNNDYDLYRFNQNAVLEWENWEQTGGNHHFNLESSRGYLYANSDNVTLNFIGAINPSNSNITVNNLGYTNGAQFAGWNLVGNPFMCNAYIGRSFYRLTPESEDLVPVDNGAIAPLEGVFVQATSENRSVTFSREVVQSKGSVLNVNVIRKEANVDVARVRFGEGEGLEKFQLNPNHTKVYFPQNGKNYAVVNTGRVDELPFNFEAENDDTFTLNFTQEQVEFSYLHLIDNLTGANIDLLQQPEYTFESKVSDYPSRFKVVFVAKDAEGAIESSEAFAFNSNGDFVIVNEGQATLQVIDLQGRMISSETIEGCVSKTLQVAPGVYVLRMINGENIRVQKVVVR